MTSTIPVTDRTKVRRLPKRGTYERETIHAIIDEALICHVGFIVDGAGAPVVIPTIHWRDGDTLYVHGSAGSLQLAAPVVGMLPTTGGGGYWLVGADGGIFTYGDAPFLGAG